MNYTCSTIAYGDSGNALAVNQPNTLNRLKVANYETWVDSVTQNAITGTASENLSLLDGIHDKILIFAGKTSQDLYYSTDGTTVTEFQDSVTVYQAFVYEASAGVYNVISFEGVIGTGLDVYHYADITGGSPTRTRVQEDSSDWTLRANERIQDNDFARNPDTGTLLMGTYYNPGTSVATVTYRSTDGGLNWTAVDTLSPGDTGTNNHGHCVAYLSNLPNPSGDTIVAISVKGDGPDNKKERYSLDDGVTWASRSGGVLFDDQPIGLWDHPNGTDILVAEDSPLQCCVRTYTVDDFSAGDPKRPERIAADTGAPRSGSNLNQRFAWANTPYGGLIYSGTMTVAARDIGTISISSDGRTYTTIYNFGTNVLGPQKFVGLGGYIHAAVRKSGDAIFERDYYRFATPSTTSSQVVRVSPGATNETTDADQSTGDDSSASVENSANGSVADGTGGEVGEGTVQGVLDQAGNLSLRGPREVMTATEIVTGVMHARGEELVQRCRIGVYDQDGTATISEAALTAADNFMPVYFPPTAMANTGHRAELLVATGNPAGAYAEYDRIAMFSGASLVQPHPWVIGGTAQAKQHLSETVARGASWTETITLFTYFDSSLIVGDCPIFTYSRGDSFATLLWDGANARFALDVTIDGSAETRINGTATRFDRNAQIDITTTVDGSNTDIKVVMAGYEQTFEGAGASDLINGDITWQTGDDSGAGTMVAYVEQAGSQYTTLGHGRLGVIGRPLQGRM